MPRTPEDQVAVIGVGGIFPGAADVHVFWRNVEAGKDAITEAPPGRLPRQFLDPASDEVDRLPTLRGGFIGEAFDFDALGFGVMPVAAEGAEPDQLLALEVAARTVADAGYEGRELPRDKAAVILGRGGYLTPGLTRLFQTVRGAGEVVDLLRHLVPGLDEGTLDRVRRAWRAGAGTFGPDTAIGLVPNLAASRIASRLDLRGPAYTVDAACASALVAVEQGVTLLRSGRADLVLAGGIHLVQDATFWSVFAQLGALSRQGAIRPYDQGADGLLVGEGCGMVLLKRLDRAEHDGDRIYAVIRGVGTSSDGRAASPMAPRVEGQVAALERAWHEAGLDPATAGLVEGHGTATPTGDAAELETLRRVFGPADGPRAVLGSVKSMIGHAMPAAGAAGLVKTVLAVHHGVRPPSLHCDSPHGDLAGTRFRVTAAAEPWEGAERVAGVNAFGFGGINAHVVLAAHGVRERRRRPRPEDAPDRPILRLAAAEAAGLLARLEAAEAGAPVGVGDDPGADPDGPGARGPVRLALVDPTAARLARARRVIEAGVPWRGREGIWFSPRALGTDGGKVAFLFPGVDAAFEPRVEDVAERFDLPLPPFLEAEGIEEQGMGIVGVSRLLDRVLRRLGLTPDAVAGHSIGEWTAMIVSGAIGEDAADAFIGTLRAGTLEVPGVLFAAAGCGVEVARRAIEGLGGIAVSHDNCPHQVILCGRAEAIDTARTRLVSEGVLCQVLPFRSGFHSPLFEGYLGPHRTHFAHLPLGPGRPPVWSATTCAPFPTEPDAIRELALRHLVAPVRFRELVLALHDQGFRHFVQVGTGRLQGFVEDTLRGRPHLAVSANVARRPGLAQLRNLALALWVEGVEMDLTPLVPGRRPHGRPLRISLGAPAVAVDLPPLDLAAAPKRTLPRGGGAVLDEAAETLRALDAARDDVLRAVEAWRAQAGQGGAPAAIAHTRTLSVDTVPALRDHSFFPQPEGWPVRSDCRPVVPMTMTIGLMMEAAEEAAPGRVAVAVEELRAFRWIDVHPPVEVTFTVTPAGPDRVTVAVDDYARATVVLAPAYPEAPAPAVPPLTSPRPSAIDAAELYGERWMFHGPRYQGVAAIGQVGDDGVEGELVTPEGPGALLDSAGQLFGYWVMDTRNEDRLAMPVGLGRLEVFGPHPPVGTRLHCEVRITALDAREVRGDLVLSTGDRVWARIQGWTDHRFPSDIRLWSVLRKPEDNLLCQVPAAYVLYDDGEHRPPSRDWLMRRYLGEAERVAMLEAGPRRQRQLLHGRIAAKDAVRRLLWEGGEGPRFPVEVPIDGDDAGLLRAAIGGRDLRVAVAHLGDRSVAVAAEGRPVGIAIVPIAPVEDAEVARRLDAGERRLLDEQEGGAFEGLARLLAAKEAAAVAAAGAAGADGAPRVREVAGRRVRVGDGWFETRVDGEAVVAFSVV